MDKVEVRILDTLVAAEKVTCTGVVAVLTEKNTSDTCVRRVKRLLSVPKPAGNVVVVNALRLDAATVR